MPTPFPGMDPYLENPVFWPDVHNSLIAEIRNDLAPKLLPRYYVALEERLYMAEREESNFISRPDVAVLEPSSAAPSQPKVIATTANGLATIEPVLVEVPFMEEIRETFLEVREAKSHVVVTVIELLSPVNKRPGLGCKPFTIRQAIPSFYLPLQPNDEEPVVDLTTLLHALIERVGYQFRIDYSVDATPPLAKDDALWTDAQLRAVGFR